MDIAKVITKDVVSLHIDGSTKEEIIESLLDLLMKSGKVKDREAALLSILDRERKMSTGIQFGIAIPHGKTDTVNELVACIGIRKEGIDFEALDGQPCRIFIMTLSPTTKTGPHVQFLGSISHLLKSEEKRQEIINAKSADEIVSIMCG